MPSNKNKKSSKLRVAKMLQQSELLSEEKKASWLERIGGFSEDECKKLLSALSEEPEFLMTQLQDCLDHALMEGDRETVKAFEQMVNKEKRAVLKAEEKHDSSEDEQQLENLDKELNEL